MEAKRHQVGFDDEGLPVYLDENRDAWAFDPKKAAYKPYEGMQVGDVVCWFNHPRCQVLRLGEPSRDRFGREQKGHWALALDGSGREGYLLYGPGGQAPVEFPA